MNKVIIWVLIILVLVIGGVWISNRSNQVTNQNSQDENVVTNDRSGVEGESDTEGAKDDVTENKMEDGVINIETFDVSGAEFSFSADEIKVKKDDIVKVTFKNSGKFPHDFRIDEFNTATKILQPGEEETIEFVADQSGTFEYYCSVGNHRAQGMVGNFIVE